MHICIPCDPTDVVLRFQHSLGVFKVLLPYFFKLILSITLRSLSGKCAQNMLAPASLFILASVLQTTAALVGNATVLNNCKFNVTVTSVSRYNTFGPDTLTTGENYSEQYQVGDGAAIKITLEPDGLNNGAAQLIFSYDLSGYEPEYVNIDLNAQAGTNNPNITNPLAGNNLAVNPNNSSCSAHIFWPDGNEPAEHDTEACTVDYSITLTLCAPSQS